MIWLESNNYDEGGNLFEAFSLRAALTSRCYARAAAHSKNNQTVGALSAIIRFTSEGPIRFQQAMPAD